MLCKELVKPAMHMGRTESAMREWEEVEVRTQRLVRLEKMWGKSGSAGNASSSNLNTVGGLTSSGLSAAAEERERRLFCETLRDGFVLCQYVSFFFTRFKKKNVSAALSVMTNTWFMQDDE